MAINGYSILTYNWKEDTDKRLKLFIYINTVLVHKFDPNWGN